jgi:hypothetical protein
MVHGEVRGGEWHGSWVLRTSNWWFESLWRWGTCLWCFVTRSSGMASGATTQEKFKGLPYRVKIQGPALICWRHCFMNVYFLQGENLWCMIDRQWCLCTVSFLEALLLEKLYFWCSLGGLSALLVVLVLVLQEIDYFSGTFLCISFFWLCASVILLGQCVVAEAGCNWFFAILISAPYRERGPHAPPPCHHADSTAWRHCTTIQTQREGLIILEP